MYSGNLRKKIYYLLADVLALIISYIVLSSVYSYAIFDSYFFAAFFGILVIFISVLNNDYSSFAGQNFVTNAKKSIAYGLRVSILFTSVLCLGHFHFVKIIGHPVYYLVSQLFVLVTLTLLIGRQLTTYWLKESQKEAKKVLLVTDFNNSRALEANLQASNYDVIAYISNCINAEVDKDVLQNEKEIRDFVSCHQVDEIVVSRNNQAIVSKFAHCLKCLGIPTTLDLTGNAGKANSESTLIKLGSKTYVTFASNIVKGRQIVLKRLMDIVIAIVGIILTGLVALIIAPIVKKQSPGPLIFKQKRVGKNGKVFEIYKFRSMYTDAEERKKELMAQNDLDTDLMFKMEDDPRIFPFGHKLRDWSLDELPQFINVLKGDMSVVGTRPPTLDEYHRYELHHFKRLLAKPGITGLWQVSGRSDITDFEEVVALDMDYIQHWTLFTDIKIILKTFAVVLKREGSR